MFRDGDESGDENLRNRYRFQSLLAICVAATGLGAMPQSPAAKNGRRPVLKEVLARMDNTAGRLKTLSASLEYTVVTALVDDKSTEMGKIFYRKGPQVLIEFSAPSERKFFFGGDRAEVYYPKINQLQEYKLENHQGMIEQFLLLGFGTNSSRLRKSYHLKMVGEEVLDGDAVVVLELIPKDEEVRERLKKVILWISEESWLPVQQKFSKPGGDYTVAKYSSVKVNRALSASRLKIKTKRDTTRVRMNN